VDLTDAEYELRTATLRRAALAYARRGWRVLPLWWPAPSGECACGRPDCDSTGKHPIRRLVPHGLHDATSQLDAVAGWWRSVPYANVGIRRRRTRTSSAEETRFERILTGENIGSRALALLS
jgi:Bifunctional DNA primase/polymerase, N-terminal